MVTASRTRQPAGGKPRTAASMVTALIALDALRTWVVPGVASAVIVACAVLSSAGLLPTAGALAGAALAALVLLLYLGMRPLLVDAAQPRRVLALAAALAAAWLVACYVPFHARLFPGTPLVDAVQVTAAGQGLPLRIPAAGHPAIDLLLEGKLIPNPGGGAAPPVRFRLTLEDGAGTPRIVEGMFQDTLRTQRLGRRGTTVVHQTHTADVRVLPNPGRQDLTVTQLVLEPATSPAVTISAFAHPLPGPLVLAVAVIALLAAVVAFDRLGPVPETDGALTLATAAVVGTAIIFWTSNAVRPDFRTLIGSAILGGPLGLAAGALLWWVAKRLIVRPAR